MSEQPGREYDEHADTDRVAAVILLAAGAGTRMKSKRSKVLHELCGRSMIRHVLAAMYSLTPGHLVVVVGHDQGAVAAEIGDLEPLPLLAEQTDPLGTGHAVRVGLEELGRVAGAVDGVVLVVYADTPLLEGATLSALAAAHSGSGHAVTVLTAEPADPFGYGRVIRDDAGEVSAIVEEKDATPQQAEVREINSGIYAFDGAFLAAVLPRIGNDNAKGEFYLTDVVGLAREDGRSVGAHRLEDARQVEGANDRAQLADLAAEMNRRTLMRWMRDGVTVADPGSTWVDVDVTLSADVTLLPGVQLLGATTVAEDAVVGPDCTLKDVEVGAAAKVVRTHAELAVIGAGANVGPFSYLRPGTVLGRDGKVGGFVETKNASIGVGAKVPHLSYVGDAEVGEGSNIGAGTIFANYDGVDKHRTVVGRDARTGANNTFVAPVRIGDGAGTGAGAVVRRDVPPGALAVSGGPQRNLEGWAERKRPGTAQAEAARTARAPQPDGERQSG